MIDIKWLAGFFDGEGCISITSVAARKGGKRYPAVRIALTQKDRNILEEIQKKHGGRIFKHKTSNCHALQWQSQKEMKAILETLAPHLVIKKQKALDAIKTIGIPKDRSYSLQKAHEATRERWKKKGV